MGTPILAPKPRASAGKSRRAMRCKASAATDVDEAKDLGYPFVKIVGQDELKLALTLNVIVRAARFLLGDATDRARVRERAGSRFRTRERVVVIPTPAPPRPPPRAPSELPLTSVFLLLLPRPTRPQDSKIGGCLIMGDRGTGKSVAVRALQDLLPEIPVVPNDAFNSSPSDPELMGPEALEAFRTSHEAGGDHHARAHGGGAPRHHRGPHLRYHRHREGAGGGREGVRRRLLARANRLLYIDEVNLLDDSLVDVVLDSAAGGWNTVEREGISITHPAKFIMIGSGNPEEGELRPQLLDRFGMACNISTIFDREQRVQLVKNRMAFEADPEAFALSCKEETDELRAKISAARALLPEITMDRDLALKISGVCALVDVDGLRGDIVVTRAAKALVAYEGRKEVTQEDIQRVIGPCLSHRLRKDPMDTMDGSFKVMLGFNKVFNGSALKNFSEAMDEGIVDPEAKKAEEEEAAKPPEPKKAGAWGGLPGSR